MFTPRIALLALIFSSSLLILSAPDPAQAGGKCKGKVTVCHRPPGNPGNAHTIKVSASALRAHLAHGDQIGACAPECRSNGSTCEGDAACCSGFCNDGACATPCAAEGSACGTGGDCCSGNCQNGQCGAACANDGNGCATGADCCSGICTDTTKTCASQCTIGPELHGPPCHEDLDCCEGQGICIIGLCYPENFGCSAIGEACNPDEGAFCCFDNACVEGVCVE